MFFVISTKILVFDSIYINKTFLFYPVTSRMSLNRFNRPEQSDFSAFLHRFSVFLSLNSVELHHSSCISVQK